jgi:hypothetical protein
LGVEPNLNLVQLKDDPFVSHLIKHALGELCWSESSQKEAIALVIDQALKDATRLDIGSEELAQQWKVIENLFEICTSPNTTPRQLLAVLGLPPCEPTELGTKQHLSVMDRVGQELESQGISPAFESWVSSAQDNIDSLDAVRSFIRERSDNGPTFAKSPLSYYRLPVEDVIAGIIPTWWDLLNLASWDELLQSDVAQDKSIRVIAQGALVEAGAKLPIIFQDFCNFVISVEDDKPDGIVVKVSVAKGKVFKAIGEVRLEGRTGIFKDHDPQDHQSPLRYRFEADGFLSESVKVIALDNYSPGIIVHSRGASKNSLFKKVGKSKIANNYESDLEFPGVGSHHVDILHRKDISIGNQITSTDTNSDMYEPEQRPINKSSDTSSATLIQTDDESEHRFTALIQGEKVELRLFVRAFDTPPVGATSEFDRLILEHRNFSRRTGGATRVEPIACRANDLERWVLENPDSFNPIVLGDDYLRAWANPDWKSQPVLSMSILHHDPRPDPSSFHPPDSYKQSRANLQKALLHEASSDEIIETVAIGERMRDEYFRNIVDQYLNEYNNWLKNDYESAIWSDVITVHSLDASGTALNSYPHAILLTPLHPVRFGWQCVAQALLQDAINLRLRCPAASILDPRSTPDCLVLPCRTPVGKNDSRVFLSVASSSDYWGVLWSGERDQLCLLESEAGRSIFDKELGITIEGLASGFSVPQVERAIDEISFIWAAKSTLRISVTSDTSGSSSCNEGIAKWGRKELGEQDPWRMKGARKLVIYDDRQSDLQPEDAELSTLTQELDSSIEWYSRPKDALQADLGIIAHLGTQDPDLDTTRKIIQSKSLSMQPALESFALKTYL